MLLPKFDYHLFTCDFAEQKTLFSNNGAKQVMVYVHTLAFVQCLRAASCGKRLCGHRRENTFGHNSD